MPTYDLIATAAFGLESQVAYELKQLGYTDQHVEAGRVTFRGDLAAIARANLWLRSADRVLLRMGEFPARTFDELFDRIRALPWAAVMQKDAFIHVLEGRTVKSQLTSMPAIQGVVKKAIVDAVASKYKLERLPENGPRYKVMIALLEDVATIAIDTSGDGLHKRGYRPAVAPAPLKETLGAGLITLARWFWDRPFADPLCGSGTLPIEAAMIGLNIAPGKYRKFDAEEWPFVTPATWQKARKEAIDAEELGRQLNIYGADVSPDAIRLAEANARHARVERQIRFECRPVKDFAPTSQYGFIVTNPPYGERLGEEHEVEALEREMGEAFRRDATWGVYVLTAHEAFERFYGKAAEKKRKLFNGKLRCDFYQYPGPRRPRPS